MFERGRKKKDKTKHISVLRVSDDTLLLLLRASTDVLEAVTARSSVFIFCHFLNNLIKNTVAMSECCLMRRGIHLGAHPALPWPLGETDTVQHSESVLILLK